MDGELVIAPFTILAYYDSCVLPSGELKKLGKLHIPLNNIRFSSYPTAKLILCEVETVTISSSGSVESLLTNNGYLTRMVVNGTITCILTFAPVQK